MRKSKVGSLPPIAVEERPEKLALTLSIALKRSLDEFSEYFESTTGSIPSSFNAVVVGILTGYLDEHGGYQKWLKSRSRPVRPAINGHEASSSPL
jgi:hypothetical protein